MSRQKAYEGGKFFNPAHRSLLPRMYFWYSFLLEGRCADGRIFQLTLSGIESAIFLVLARGLKQIRY
jgi:hypothetical protein